MKISLLSRYIQSNAVEAMKAVNTLQDLCHVAAARSGWWAEHPMYRRIRLLIMDSPDIQDNQLRQEMVDALEQKFSRNKGELISLMHSELSEMLEGVRKDLADDHLPEFDSETVELADLIIRAFDYAGKHELPLAQALVKKLKYNAVRADHKPENRQKPGGKNF